MLCVSVVQASTCKWMDIVPCVCIQVKATHRLETAFWNGIITYFGVCKEKSVLYGILGGSVTFFVRAYSG